MLTGDSEFVCVPGVPKNSKLFLAWKIRHGLNVWFFSIVAWYPVYRTDEDVDPARHLVPRRIGSK